MRSKIATRLREGDEQVANYFASARESIAGGCLVRLATDLHQHSGLVTRASWDFATKFSLLRARPQRLRANLDRVFAGHASSQTFRVTCRPLSVLPLIPDSRQVPRKSWSRVSWAFYLLPPPPRDERTSRASTGMRGKEKSKWKSSVSNAQ